MNFDVSDAKRRTAEVICHFEAADECFSVFCISDTQGAVCTTVREREGGGEGRGGGTATKEKRGERAHKESGQKGEKKQRDIDKNTEIRGN